MSTEPESFLARWSRRKREVEREAQREAERPSAIVEPPAPTANSGGEAGAEDRSATTPELTREPAATTETSLPPIESLDGLRSDYQAFFQQPVGDDLRHAALKKLFADPHFNQMDMLDVYVDDYTQFEPLPAALRMRLPSARAFLADAERAVVEAAEAAEAAAGDGAASGAAAVVDAKESEPVEFRASVDSTSESAAASDAASNGASAADRVETSSESPPPAVPPGKATASDSSSS